VDGSLASLVDAGGGDVVYSIVRQAAGGTVTLDAASGDFTYARSSAARGDLDRFSYRVTDAAGRWSEAEVRIVYGARRIMPLGDSITDGVERYHPSTGSLPAVASRTGYRKALHQRLVAAGYAVAFVGAERSGFAAGLADADHEGHPGYRQTNIRDEIGGWLDHSPADVVLLHIGTNDLNAASVTDVTATGEALSRMASWSADPQKPALTVMLATVIGQRFGGAALVPTFNANLVALHAGQWAMPTDRFAVSLVDLHSAVDVARHLSDPADDVTGLHPNAEGYERIAGAWFDALVQSQAVRRCP
jgi:lysophospholipase L1-like esterase